MSDTKQAEAFWSAIEKAGAPRVKFLRTTQPMVFGGYQDDKIEAGKNAQILLTPRENALVKHRPPAPENAPWTVYFVGNVRQAVME